MGTMSLKEAIGRLGEVSKLFDEYREQANAFAQELGYDSGCIKLDNNDTNEPGDVYVTCTSYGRWGGHDEDFDEDFGYTVSFVDLATVKEAQKAAQRILEARRLEAEKAKAADEERKAVELEQRDLKDYERLRRKFEGDAAARITKELGDGGTG